MGRHRCEGMAGKHMGRHHIPGYPIIPFVFPMASALLSATCALWMLARMTRAKEVIAMTNALEKLGDRLNDDETKELETRIREKLFSPCCR